MQIKIIRAAALCLTVMLGIGIYLAGCNDKKGTQPEPPITRQYPVYFTASGMNGENPLCYQYYPATGEVDSFPLPVWPRYNMAVSADGSQLWVSRYDTVYVVDIKSRSLIAALPYIGTGQKVVFSQDNRLAALSGHGLYLIDPQSYSIIYHDTAASWYFPGQFSADGSRYYCEIYGDYAYKIDLNCGTTDTLCKVENRGSVEQILPSLDETRLFIITRLDIYTSGFFVYDISLDSIIYGRPFAPQPARIKTSPCGRYVYLTVGGTLNSVDPFPFSFAIYDDQTGDFIEEVKIVTDDPPLPFFPLDRFAVTPNGRYLIGTWFNEPNYYPIYDFLQADTVVVLRLGDKYGGTVECQIGY